MLRTSLGQNLKRGERTRQTQLRVGARGGALSPLAILGWQALMQAPEWIPERDNSRQSVSLLVQSPPRPRALCVDLSHP